MPKKKKPRVDAAALSKARSGEALPSFSEEAVTAILDHLKEQFPEAGCELVFADHFQLLVAVVLSAQTTDKSVNRVTPALFEKYPNAFAMARAGETEAEAQGLDLSSLTADELLELGVLAISEIIRSIGMYRGKAKNLIRLSAELAAQYGGNVPDDYDQLTALPGVGRKTANVVLSVGFGHQRIAVDTHVFRVASRIGLAPDKDVLTTENALMALLPENRWSEAHHSLLFLGRYCCTARKPDCESCRITQYCREFRAKQVEGRTTKGETAKGATK